MIDLLSLIFIELNLFLYRLLFFFFIIWIVPLIFLFFFLFIWFRYFIFLWARQLFIIGVLFRIVYDHFNLKLNVVERKLILENFVERSIPFEPCLIEPQTKLPDIHFAHSLFLELSNYPANLCGSSNTHYKQYVLAVHEFQVVLLLLLVSSGRRLFCRAHLQVIVVHFYLLT